MTGVQDARTHKACLYISSDLHISATMTEDANPQSRGGAEEGGWWAG